MSSDKSSKKGKKSSPEEQKWQQALDIALSLPETPNHVNETERHQIALLRGEISCLRSPGQQDPLFPLRERMWEITRPFNVSEAYCNLQCGTCEEIHVLCCYNDNN